ncbi:MAG: hypothetical protein WC478_05600 [Candidatus Omnitrophota bacterium]
MDSKNVCVVNSILWGAGILLLLAGAFDVLPWPDNQVIFLAIACFIVGAVIRRIAKGTGSGCCK